MERGRREQSVAPAEEDFGRNDLDKLEGGTSRSDMSNRTYCKDGDVL